MKLQILGTSSGRSTKTRETSGSVLVYTDGQSRQKLAIIDPSDGFLSRFKKENWSLNNVTHIFVTHAHGDHYFGLFAILSELGLTSRKDIKLFVPFEMYEIVREYLNIAKKNDSFFDFVKVNYVSHVSCNTQYSLSPRASFFISELQHGVSSYAYTFEFSGNETVDIQKMKDDGYKLTDVARLKNNPRYQITKPDVNLIYCGDNENVRLIGQIIDNLELEGEIHVYHEGTYTRDIYNKLAIENKTHGHCSIYQISKEIGRLSKEHDINLILSHFSPRIQNVGDIINDISYSCEKYIIAEDNIVINL